MRSSLLALVLFLLLALSTVAVVALLTIAPAYALHACRPLHAAAGGPAGVLAGPPSSIRPMTVVRAGPTAGPRPE
jgi:hypothetical protein